MTQDITIYHSPDADDAFMFYGLSKGHVTTPGFTYSHELKDIETLNQMTLKGETSVTAVSVHVYPHLEGRYAILRSGASMGGPEYGPRLVARDSFDLSDGKIRKFAVPGELTSATLALKICLHERGIEAELVNMNFDRVQEAVKAGEVDAGVIIHEGQITLHKEGLLNVLDLGKWWWDITGLPLPLGVNVVRKDLGDAAMRSVAKALKETIQFSLAHRQEAIDFALGYGRGISREEADEFIGMYVNDITVEMGERGESSIRLFLEKGARYGFVPEVANLEFV